MELNKLLERVTAGFVRTRTEEAEMERDAAIADVALMIAALDGSVQSEELAAYRWIAGRCPALTDGERRRHLDAAVRKAGHLLLMAQIDEYSTDDLLAAFDAAFDDALPRGFAGFSRSDVRRAFALWISAALADGDFSDLERLALGRQLARVPAETLPEAGFFETAERLLRNLADPERRSETEAALDRLVVFS